ncbi:MAG: sulfite exporter TauE/SafE family protein [Clostridia bacterium]|nr:sulfite exporter TauE/SafE family protein [Clostridia bacterium]
MYCHKCRAELAEDAERCFSCGAAVDDGCGEDNIAAFFEANEARVKESKTIKDGFLSTRFGKALFAFICFGIIAMAVSFGKGDIVSGVIAILMTVCAIISFFVGVRIIKVPSEEVKFLVAIIALMFVIPYFSAYNPVGDRARSADVTAVVEEDVELTEDAESVETFSVQEDDEKEEAVEDEEQTEAPMETETEAVGEVYVTPTGKKYHLDNKCAGVNAIPKSKAEVEGKYEPCKKCAK